MNKKLELDMSELLIAAFNKNPDRMTKIFQRLDNDNKEKLARALIATLSATFHRLPAGTVMNIQREFGFDLVTVEVT